MTWETVGLVMLHMALGFYVAVGVFGCVTLSFCAVKFVFWDVPRAVVAWHRHRKWRKRLSEESPSGWQWYAGAGRWHGVKSKEYADYLRSMGLEVVERGTGKDKEEGRG